MISGASRTTLVNILHRSKPKKYLQTKVNNQGRNVPRKGIFVCFLGGGDNFPSPSPLSMLAYGWTDQSQQDFSSLCRNMLKTKIAAFKLTGQTQGLKLLGDLARSSGAGLSAPNCSFWFRRFPTLQAASPPDQATPLPDSPTPCPPRLPLTRPFDPASPADLTEGGLDSHRNCR